MLLGLQFVFTEAVITSERAMANPIVPRDVRTVDEFAVAVEIPVSFLKHVHLFPIGSQWIPFRETELVSLWKRRRVALADRHKPSQVRFHLKLSSIAIARVSCHSRLWLQHRWSECGLIEHVLVVPLLIGVCVVHVPDILIAMEIPQIGTHHIELRKCLLCNFRKYMIKGLAWMLALNIRSH